MATHVLCGRCGATLAHPSAACANCGATPAYQAHPYRRYNPMAAVALSIIPGLGHIYLGHWKKGLVYMAMAGGLQFFGADIPFPLNLIKVSKKSGGGVGPLLCDGTVQ